MVIACHAILGDGSIDYYRYTGPAVAPGRYGGHRRIHNGLKWLADHEYTEGMFEVVEAGHQNYPGEGDVIFDIEDADELIKILCWWALGGP